MRPKASLTDSYEGNVMNADGIRILNTNPLAYAAESGLNNKIKALECYAEGAEITDHHWDRTNNTIQFFYIIPEGLEPEHEEQLEKAIKEIISSFSL